MEKLTNLSKKMSFALRHQPEQFNLVLDNEGWAELDTFAHKLGTTVEIVQQVVAQDSKQRYTIQNGKIRAAQGHTIPVSIKFATPEPPAVLWHGTTEAALPSIMEIGLSPMQRQYVHLSASREQAEIVGSRHKGKLVVLSINTAELTTQRIPLMMAENGVWLANFVPVSCITVS
jgi:putative RNA 2'-phosphotransferase